MQCAKEAHRKKNMFSLGFGAVLGLGEGGLQKKVTYKQSL